MKRSTAQLAATLVCLGPCACSPSGPPIKVDAAELAASYFSNAPAASARFRGHPLIVTGVSGGVDSSNILTLIPGVLADVRSDASSVGFGSSVTIKCDFVSADENEVHLHGCNVEDTHLITLDEVAAQTDAMYNQDLAEQEAQSH